MTQKIFVVNFITSYLPLFLTSYLYMPFGKFLVPYLDIFKTTVETVASNEKIASGTFHINHERLPSQMVYFTVTAQFVNFLTETIVPYVKHKVFAKVKEVQGKGNNVQADVPEEAAFLARVRNEAELEVYDVAGDYREMVVQFGKRCEPRLLFGASHSS
jgi:anoctamin-10